MNLGDAVQRLRCKEKLLPQQVELLDELGFSWEDPGEFFDWGGPLSPSEQTFEVLYI